MCAQTSTDDPAQHRPLAGRLTRQPIALDAARGAEVAARFGMLAPELQGLIAGTAGCSPYLAGLLAREAEWVEAVLPGAPEPALAEELARLGGFGPDRLPTELRRAKRRVALLAALADLGGAWPLEAVTGALTALADRAVDLSLKTLVAEEIRRGKLPGAGPADAADAAGLVALAMGKMGAGELNYSSDIDLICLFDEERHDPAAYHEVRAGLIRAVRKMTGWLSDITAEGYVFRTDLRLRPDASVTPVCIGMEAAELYYEAEGRNWERSAYIKARAAAGDIAAGKRFLQRLTPFVWRRHLDFATIRDVHDMRRRIRDHKGLHGPLTLEGHDMKLGAGGIREIEFFTQTRQLIAGGRDPDLRDPTTVGGLAALAAKGWLPSGDAAALTTLYRQHREVEHRLQMANDAQTHALPGTPEGFDRLARMMGEGDTARLRATLRQRLEDVTALTDEFFAREGRAMAPAGVAEGLSEGHAAGMARVAESPKALPPELAEAARAITDRWRGYPALRSNRARDSFARFEPELLSRMGRAANPLEALGQFDGFLHGLPAGVQLFAMFEANPPLVELIVDICATAPGLARYLSRNSGVLDAVLAGDFFAPWPGQAALQQLLARALARIADYERKLDEARRWMKEWHFRIGVHHLRGLVDAAEAGAMYADLAQAVVAALWTPVTEDFARRHGPMPGQGAVVLGMGSLGAGRLNAASDLDLIVIYEAGGVEQSAGPRPLAARAYYARLTQALVTALSAPMAGGRLYEVDMRLRPSGRQGPVATALAAFRSYQMEEAWTWEHLALTRARPIAGEPGLAREVEALRRAVLVARARGRIGPPGTAEQPGGGATILADTADMRRRIFAAKAPDGAWEAKIGPGRLQDIELFAQSLALRAADGAHGTGAQLRAGRRAGLIAAATEAELAATERFLWRLQAGGRLLTDRPLDMEQIGDGGRAFLLRETDAPGLEALAETLAARTARAAALIEAGLGLPEAS